MTATRSAAEIAATHPSLWVRGLTPKEAREWHELTAQAADLDRQRAKVTKRLILLRNRSNNRRYKAMERAAKENAGA